MTFPKSRVLLHRCWLQLYTHNTLVCLQKTYLCFRTPMQQNTISHTKHFSKIEIADGGFVCAFICCSSDSIKLLCDCHSFPIDLERMIFLPLIEKSHFMAKQMDDQAIQLYHPLLGRRSAICRDS